MMDKEKKKSDTNNDSFSIILPQSFSITLPQSIVLGSIFIGIAGCSMSEDYRNAAKYAAEQDAQAATQEAEYAAESACYRSLGPKLQPNEEIVFERPSFFSTSKTSRCFIQPR